MAKAHRHGDGKRDDGARASRPGLGLEPHGERRWRQLLAVTAHIIETEGPDAVRMPRVAELAGCTRTLVYRYFPQREDLLAGVFFSFYERLNTRTSVEEHARSIAGLADPDPEAAWRACRGLLEATWDVVEELGIAGLILARAEFPNSSRMAGHMSEQAKETERRWFQPLRARGLSDASCAVALECATSITFTLMKRHRAGSIEREEAVALAFRSLHALIRALREGGGT